MLSAWNYRSYFLHTCTYTCVLEYMQTKKVDFFVSIPPLTAGVLRCRGTCSSSHSVCTFVVHVCASIVCTLAYTCISSRSSHSVWRYSSWSSDRRVYVLLWYTRVQHTSMDVYCKTYRYTCTCTGTGSMLFNIGAACMHGRMMIEARGSMLLQYMLPLDWSMPLNVEIWIATCNNIWPYYLLPYSSTLCTGSVYIYIVPVWLDAWLGLLHATIVSWTTKIGHTYMIRWEENRRNPQHQDFRENNVQRLQVVHASILVEKIKLWNMRIWSTKSTFRHFDAILKLGHGLKLDKLSRTEIKRCIYPWKVVKYNSF